MVSKYNNKPQFCIYSFHAKWQKLSNINFFSIMTWNFSTFKILGENVLQFTIFLALNKYDVLDHIITSHPITKCVLWLEAWAVKWITFPSNVGGQHFVTLNYVLKVWLCPKVVIILFLLFVLWLLRLLARTL